MAEEPQEKVVLLSVEDRVGRIILNRPKKRGALSAKLIGELASALATLGNDEDCHVVVVSSNGPGFSAGDDLMGYPPTSDEAQACIRAFELCPVPVILAIHGFCFTGALELILGADMIVAGDRTTFQDTHAKFGLVPTWRVGAKSLSFRPIETQTGATLTCSLITLRRGLPARLPSKIGKQRASEVMFLGEPFTAQEACAWGLVNRVAPEDSVVTEAVAMAGKTAQLSRSAVVKTKRMMVESSHASLGDALRSIDQFHPGQGNDIKERIKMLFARSSRAKKKKNKNQQAKL